MLILIRAATEIDQEKVRVKRDSESLTKFFMKILPDTYSDFFGLD